MSAPAAAPAAPTAEVERVRVAVMVAAYQVDVVIPTRFTVETYIDDLVAVLAEAIADESVDFVPAQGQWSLARPGQLPIPRWRSLADHGIADGAVLALSAVESAEIFTPVVEDITDALALINEREFAEFDAPTSRVVGLGVLGVGATVIAALLCAGWSASGSIAWFALPALLLGASCWGAALVAWTRQQSALACLGLALSSLPLLFAGAAMLVPTPDRIPGLFAAPNNAAGAVAVAVAAAALIRLTRVGIATLMAMTMLGVLAAVAAIVLAYTEIPVGKVAAGVVLVAVILLTAAPRVAVVIARIRPPDLPDPGSDVTPATLNDIFDAATGQDPEHPDPRMPQSIESRARLAVTSLRGLIVAIATALSFAVLAICAAFPGGIREIVLALAIAGILGMRARWFPDRVQAIALIAAAVVTAAGSAFVTAASHAAPPVWLLIALLVALASAGGCVAAVRLPDKRLSPVTRRVIDLVEYALLVVVPVLAFWIMGVYTAMRQI
ncbi:type VII secretion integral membrane protein EccD [Nocardia sp. NPDC051832]|uniref:type VII secretion integral membrane protein EccD n=1 Tax=Nocardia sp. NPDC051832 TaxID=3155673 RepID=UPI00341B3A0A